MRLLAFRPSSPRRARPKHWADSELALQWTVRDLRTIQRHQPAVYRRIARLIRAAVRPAS